MVESLVFAIDDFLAFIGDGFGYLLNLGPHRFVRVFWAFVVLEIPRYLCTDLYVLLLSLFRRRASPGEAVLPPHLAGHPLVSIIAPALNEEETIAHTIRSLREQDYPNLEIVIVDDGSTDGTPEICRRLAERGLIRYFRLPDRQGKAAALNYGARVCGGEYVVFVDSDSTMDRNSVVNLLRHFADERIGAVSGNLAVRNAGVNLLTRFQAVEYLMSISVGRTFRAHAGILSIVPGAFGAFRKSILQRIGGHEPGPGNDSDLTIRIRKLGYQIAFAPDAVCLTNAPTTWTALCKQRSRWDRNVVRNRVRKHRDIFNLFDRSFNVANLLSFADTIFFSGILSVVWVFYFADMLVHISDQAGVIFFANFVLHLLLRTSQFVIALFLTDRRWEYLGLAFTLPLFWLYKSVFKVVRLWAMGQELFFRWSYRDPFAPEKVRNEMEVF